MKKKIGILFWFFSLIAFGQLPLDNNGWSILTPSNDTKKVYVSSSTGNDSNNGSSPSTPVKTIAKAYQLLRSGYPDWMLLKEGDEWFEPGLGNYNFTGATEYDFRLVGRSAVEPMVITSYNNGTSCGARPVINTGASTGLNLRKVDHFAIVGIHFYAHTRDPLGNYWQGNVSGKNGLKIEYNASNILIEDCFFNFYVNNTIESYLIYPQYEQKNIKLRRNIISDNYSAGTGNGQPNAHSQGLFANGKIDGLLIEENVFDHNGWNENVSSTGSATIFNHNMYISDGHSDCENKFFMKNIVVRGNIVARGSSHGVQLRPGGKVENNLFLNNSIALFARRDSCNIINNVVLDGKDIDPNLPRGIGIEIQPSIYAVLKNNIVAHNSASHSYGAAFSIADNVPKNSNCSGQQYQVSNPVANPKLIFENNISYNWNGVQLSYSIWNSCDANSGTYVKCSWNSASIKNNVFNDHLYNSTITSALYSSNLPNFTFQNNSYYSGKSASNWFQFKANCSSNTINYDFNGWKSLVSETSPSTNIPMSGYSNPNVTISSYQTSIGMTATLDAFLSEAKKQAKCNWRTTYTANVVNNYIRQGFNMGNTNNSPIVISTVSTSNVSCNGGSDGQVSLSVSGGTSPYIYLWSNNKTTSVISNLSAGLYTVTVTDNTAQTKTTSYTITQPNAIQLSISTQTTVCGQSNGSASATVSGGTSPYIYSWSNGANGISINNLSQGVYSLTLTDSKSCKSVKSTAVNCINSPIVISTVSTSNVSCNGGSDGHVSLSVSGGTSPYTYLWSNNKTTSIISNLSAGLYTVTVTDNTAQTKTTSYTITQPNAIQLSISTQTTVCGQNNGSVTVTPSGGTSPYSYSWSNGANSSSINNLSQGVYSITLTDSKSCKSIQSAMVNCTAASLNANIDSITHVKCFGQSTGMAFINVNGGIPPYTFAWSNGETNQTASSLPAGTFSVMIKDANNQIKFLSGNVIEPTDIDVSFNLISPLCGLNDGAIQISSTIGGTQPYSYIWNNGTTASETSGLVSGVYQLTISDAKGCIKTKNITLTGPDILVTAIDFIPNTCGNNNGTATVTATGGSLPYNYSWSSGQSNYIASGLSDGYHTVITTDANGCFTVDSLEIDCLAMTGIMEKNKERFAAVFPNPCNTVFYLNSDLSENEVIKEAFITNLSGLKIPIRVNEKSKENLLIDITNQNLVSGFYMITIITDKRVVEGKFQKIEF